MTALQAATARLARLVAAIPAAVWRLLVAPSAAARIVAAARTALPLLPWVLTAAGAVLVAVVAAARAAVARARAERAEADLRARSLQLLAAKHAAAAALMEADAAHDGIRRLGHRVLALIVALAPSRAADGALAPLRTALREPDSPFRGASVALVPAVLAACDAIAPAT
ncbi:uncharacterized protein AMSG_01500 [Thecamonas trahens ATCC 50062]|uniref:Uncharacterized protein n=1 Tax=Thecamonas trahens ATCC 50062 TaxID=461836 RepID=A0A0L0DQT8_THETB|nr:hypothetical protein AMSG_01500 [Thecamonas trahens ATCC 50062]KNC54647.1 hypothetical protein AMSG_01500 [Thecamonas trahens ATCC 50062]|eukprot:XP_013761552.1 hypothetical protein AMSG_01500 [Thecamonas trahens ATCC 50062]